MIEVRDLTKHYDTVRALKGISFQVDKGEIVGFLGPNGAGKSTAMKILTCYMPQTGGTVHVDGHDINEDSLAVRKRIGYLPESNPLYVDMMVYDYLRYVASVRGVEPKRVDERVAAVAKMCGIADRLAQTIGTLSKGYKQRVGLAQALIHDPDILILDEPTSGLDPNQIVEIRNLIRDLGREHTIILSTHNLPEVMATCSRMIIIHDGKLVADGTPAELEAREDEHLRLVVTLRGADEATAKEALGAVDGVDVVTVRPTTTPDAVSFELEGPRDSQAQEAIFRLAVDRGWVILELHRQVLDLEGIFRKLTQEV